jgi:hypothetical protein
MSGRLPGWALLVYLAIDLSNPFVPGAFRFTPEEGAVWVEAASHLRVGVESDAVWGLGAEDVPDPRPTIRGSEQRTGGMLHARDLTAWLAGVRTGDPPARDFPPADSDDH